MEDCNIFKDLEEKIKLGIDLVEESKTKEIDKIDNRISELERECHCLVEQLENFYASRRRNLQMSLTECQNYIDFSGVTGKKLEKFRKNRLENFEKDLLKTLKINTENLLKFIPSKSCPKYDIGELMENEKSSSVCFYFMLIIAILTVGISVIVLVYVQSPIWKQK